MICNWPGEDPANVSMPVRELVFTDEKTVANQKNHSNMKTNTQQKTYFLKHRENLFVKSHLNWLFISLYCFVIVVCIIQVLRMYSLGKVISRVFKEVGRVIWQKNKHLKMSLFLQTNLKWCFLASKTQRRQKWWCPSHD